jgi:hypothetical protein
MNLPQELDEICKDVPPWSDADCELSIAERTFLALCRTRNKPFVGAGICDNVDYYNGRGVSDYLGFDSSYPVAPPKDSGLSAFLAFWKLHKWEGEYGDNRRRLLDETIVRFAEMVLRESGG